MHTLLTDTRLAVRALGRHRGFAVVALLTIALGVGANTAVFSVVHAVLIQPLPFADGDRLVAISETARRAAVERRAVSYPNFLDWRRELRGVEALSVSAAARFTMRVGDLPERLDGELVSADYFRMLGVTPALGRPFTAADDLQGAAPVVAIADGLWTRAFARDPAVVGRTVRLDDELCTVIAVMPPGFGGITDSAQVWAPVGRLGDPAALESRGNRWIDVVIARLDGQTTTAQLEAELSGIAARLERLHAANRDRGVSVRSLREEYFGQVRPMLLVLLGAVGFVLLIACVNVANLLLARGSARQREMALRAALGARRGRVVRQLLTESVVLSLLGGGAGLIAAFWGIELLVALSPVPFPAFVRIGLDLPVLAFTLATCVASGLLFGLAPALAASRADLVGTLKRGGRDGSEAGEGLRRGLVTAEVALALVLLVGAGLMLQTLARVTERDPGFRTANLVTARLTLPGDGNAADADAAAARAAQAARQVLARVGALPQMTSISLSRDVPLGTSVSATMVRVEGSDPEPVRVYRHAVSAGFFATLGVPFVAGRDFTADDERPAARPVAIVDETMARRHWPDRSALQGRFRMGERVYEVVGVVADVQHRELLEADSADPDVYLPFFQLPGRSFAVVGRSEGDPRLAAAGIRRAVAEVDAGAPVYAVATGEDLVAQQTSRVRFTSVLLAAFALVALALTMVGIYGVTAYSVSRQTRQVGIRLALGASRADILRRVVGRGLGFIAAGLGAGAVAASWLSRLLTSLVYGVSPTDPATFAGVILLLSTVALAASLIPAIRATRIDPVVALRE